MSEDEVGEVKVREKIHPLFEVARFNPKFTVLIVLLGLVVAVLVSIGLGHVGPPVVTAAVYVGFVTSRIDSSVRVGGESVSWDEQLLNEAGTGEPS
jgi:hypothetical protein